MFASNLKELNVLGAKELKDIINELFLGLPLGEPIGLSTNSMSYCTFNILKKTKYCQIIL